MRYKSFPKVNLFLLIGKKNKNTNLHKIRSIFYLVKTNVFDEVEISLNKINDSISYYDINKNKIEIEDCIFKKALTILRKEKIINKIFFNISVQKKIPLFSGLGSGSSNVACLFKFLLENNLITYKQIKKIILQIGSDVMFFISNYDCALVSKYGEKIKKIKTPNILINLHFTNIKCSTKKVFECFDNKKTNTKKNYYLKQFLYFKIKKYRMLKNDLEESVCNLYNELFHKLSSIKKEEKDKIFLSGSGGTLFTISKLKR